jgi:transglutaminase superfamily protein
MEKLASWSLFSFSIELAAAVWFHRSRLAYLIGTAPRASGRAAVAPVSRLLTRAVLYQFAYLTSSWEEVVPRADYESFDYKPEATSVDSPIDDAPRMRVGVRQDFAHIMIALARELRIPCRYVSRYLTASSSTQSPAASLSRSI